MSGRVSELVQTCLGFHRFLHSGVWTFTDRATLPLCDRSSVCLNHQRTSNIVYIFAIFISSGPPSNEQHCIFNETYLYGHPSNWSRLQTSATARLFNLDSLCSSWLFKIFTTLWFDLLSAPLNYSIYDFKD
jgi:hypothetical protein